MADTLESMMSVMSLGSGQPPPFVVDTVETAARLRSMVENQNMVALDVEGVDLCRFGSVELVQVGTVGGTAVVDCAAAVFEKHVLPWLRELLEDESVIKIIHDPAVDADALFHLLRIDLRSVHDTQSWHCVLTSEWRRKNLNDTLREAGLATNDARDKQIYRDNPSFWATRPLTATMVELAAGDVLALMELALQQRKTASPHHTSMAESKSRQRLDFVRSCSETYLLRVHRSQAGRFFGRGGGNLRDMQGRFGVAIYAFHDANEDVASSSYRCFRVFASNSEVLTSFQQHAHEYTVKRKPSGRRR